MNSTLVLSIFVILFGAFTQSLTGFGMGLVAMSILPSILGLHVAAPLVALAGITLEIIMLFHYWKSLQFKSIWRLSVASLIAIPFGVYFYADSMNRSHYSYLG